MDTTSTPWGKATVVEEVVLDQQIEERRHDALVQLLELPDGSQALRFSARRQGAKRLTCLSLRADEVERLSEALLDTPRLAAVLRLSCG